MAQTTVDSPAHEAEITQRTRDRLRTVIPVTIAVTLLVGVLAVGVLTLRDLLDFGVWLLGSS